MPSLYSIAFGAAGCEVDLVNAEEKSKMAWQELDLNVGYQQCEDMTHTGMESEKYDLVWNFMYLSKHAEKEAFLKEMVRLSRRYILFVGVNRFNPGFFSHRLVHRVFNVPWNHGDVNFMNPFYVSRYLKDSGLKIVKAGVVDTPPYPDSLGIRDMKLHRKNTDLNKIDWHSRTIQWMKKGQYPLKISVIGIRPAQIKLPSRRLPRGDEISHVIGRSPVLRRSERRDAQRVSGLRIVGERRVVIGHLIA